MSDEEIAVTVTLGIPGEGRREFEVPPGETFAEVTDGSAYVEVTVPEVPEGPDEVAVETVSTEEQVEDNGDREWKIQSTKCVNCGERYPQDYSMCPECGEQNYELEELEP